MNPISIITSLFGLFSKTDTGAKVGASVSYLGTGLALAPVVALLVKDRDMVLATVTLGDAALIGGILAAVVLVARGTRAGV